MVLDGRTIIDKKMVLLSSEPGIDIDDQIQPNGVDLRVDKIYSITGSLSDIPREGKAKARGNLAELEPKDGWWSLAPGYKEPQIYMVDFLESVSVPGGWCSKLQTRSSLTRSGVDVVAGLYDSGFVGHLGCTLRVWAPVRIEWGAKLCQILFYKSHFNGHLYEGRYQGTNSETAIYST